MSCWKKLGIGEGGMEIGKAKSKQKVSLKGGILSWDLRDETNDIVSKQRSDEVLRKKLWLCNLVSVSFYHISISTKEK